MRRWLPLHDETTAQQPVASGVSVATVSTTAPRSLMERHRAAVVSEIKMLLVANAVCVSSMVGRLRNSVIVFGLRDMIAVCI